MRSDPELHFITRADGARLALFRQAPSRPNRRAVLIVHGATFPTSLSAAYRIDGRSWFDELCDAGFEAWGLDFQGYGASGDFPAMSGSSPPGAALDAAGQLATAIDFIRQRSSGTPLSLIAHSWGTVPAGVFLSRSPGSVERAVFYGPVVAAEGEAQDARKDVPAFIDVSCDAQWAAFSAGVPQGIEPPFGRAEFERWAARYLDAGARRASDAVRVPAGPMIDIERARGGTLPYEPAKIETPLLIVRGTWDAVTTEADSIRLLSQVRSSTRQLSWIHGGTHRLHLEKPRFELFDAVAAFLSPLSRR